MYTIFFLKIRHEKNITLALPNKFLEFNIQHSVCERAYTRDNLCRKLETIFKEIMYRHPLYCISAWL